MNAERRFNGKMIAVCCFVLFSGCSDSSSWQPSVVRQPTPEEYVIKPNAPLETPFVFRHHKDLRHSTLKTLRKRENLDQVVAPGQTRFDKAKLLADWTAKQWPHGDPFKKGLPPTDAVEILDWIRSGRTEGFCVQYATVLYQACLSFGWQARIIAIGPQDNPIGHALNEVFVDPLAKWVVLDAFYGVWYESAQTGMPLSALEIHQSLLEGKAESVLVRKLDGTKFETPLAHASWHGPLLRYYYHLRLLAKNDHLETGERYDLEPKDWVDWADAKSVLWQNSTLKPYDSHAPLADRQVRQPGDFNYRINAVYAYADRSPAPDVKRVRLQHNMPSFNHYLVRFGGAKEWTRCGDYLDIRQQPVDVVMEVLPVNSLGVVGVGTRFTLEQTPRSP